MRCSRLLVCLVLLPRAFAVSPQSSVQEQATELVRAGHLNQALDKLQKAAAQTPRDARVQNMLGVVLTELGRLKEANEAYNRALSLTPDFLAARKNRSVNAFSLGDYKFAKSEFEDLVKLTPKDFVPHLFLGLLDMEQSQWSSALPHLLEAKRLSRDSARGSLALTRVHFAMGRRSTALESVREMRTRSRSTAAERFELGVLLAQYESNAEAAEVFQELWLKELRSYSVGFNLALVYYRAGQPDAALAIVKELESRGTPSAELFSLRGWIYNKMNRLDQARDSLEQALTADPGNPDHYLDLSTILSNQGETEMAIQVITRGLQDGVEKNRLQVQMGLLYEKSRDFGEAERWYQTALKTERTVRPAYIALARLLLATERRKQALDLLANATRSFPNDPLLEYMYGSELLDSTRESDPEQLERAESVLLKALELNPFYANTHYMLGRLYLKRGDDQTARIYFEKACAFNPKHTDAYYQWLRIAVQRGEKDKVAELSEIVRRLHDEEKKQIQGTVTGVVEESLRASPEGILLTRSTN